MPPHRDSDFAQYVSRPELGKLLPVLYPGVFPNLATLTEVDRGDLLAILLTGIPAGLIPGFQNFTGPTYADMLRLNVAIPPSSRRRTSTASSVATSPASRTGGGCSTTSSPSSCRRSPGRPIRSSTTTYVPDGAASLINDGVTPPGNVSYLDVFPYLDHPVSGYDVQPLSA